MKTSSQQKLKKATQYHFWVVLGSFFFTLIFEFLSHRQFFSDLFLYIFVFMIIQIELFSWIGGKIFDKLTYATVPEFINRVLKRLGYFYLAVISLGFILFVLSGIIVSIIHGADPMEFIRNIPKYELRGFIIGASIGLLLGTVFFFLVQLFQAIRRVQKLNEEKLQYQYQTLKNQVNPHFLFNSLNTLSSLVYTDPKVADDFIQKLASSYRYILDNNQNNLVPLSNELKFVKEYFYLHQLRGQEKFQLQMHEFPNHFFILPVSIQLLVENALKHNAATKESPLIIKISREGVDYILVSNNKQAIQELGNSPQTGLKNLGERVQQICGKELIILETMDHYSVKIPLMKSDESIDH